MFTPRIGLSPGIHCSDVAVDTVMFEPSPGLRHNLTVSVGVWCSSEQVTTPEMLLHAADLALYEAKRRGCNRVELAPLTPLASVS